MKLLHGGLKQIKPPWDNLSNIHYNISSNLMIVSSAIVLTFLFCLTLSQYNLQS